jgi:hypothetical protein
MAPFCKYCKKKRHTEKICYKKHPEKNPRSAKSSKESASTLYAKVEEKWNGETREVNILMVGTVETRNQEDWYLDSAATDYYAIDKDSFTTYKPLDNIISVQVGNKECVSALGIGTIYLKAKMGRWSRLIKVENVYYTPDLDCNLLSAGMLLDRGYMIVMKNNGARILKNNKLIITASKVGRLFRLNLDNTYTGNTMQKDTGLYARIAIRMDNANDKGKQNIYKKPEDNNSKKNIIKPSRIPIYKKNKNNVSKYIQRGSVGIVGKIVECTCRISCKDGCVGASRNDASHTDHMIRWIILPLGNDG